MSPDQKILENRKRLIFRSWHRGTREVDLLLGPFADRYVMQFSPSELALFDQILEQPDTDIFDWVLRKVEIPSHLNNTVMTLLLSFHGIKKS